MKVIGQLLVLTALALMLASVLSAADAAVLLLNALAVLSLGLFALLAKGAWHARLPAIVAVFSGLLIPTIPWIGQEALLSLGLVCLLFWYASPAASLATGLWVTPLLGYAFASAVGELWFAFDVSGAFHYSLTRGVVIDGLLRVGDLWRALFANHLNSLLLCARVFVFAAAVDCLGGNPKRRDYFVRALLIGVACSAVYAIAQWLGLLPFSLSNQTPLWISLHRVSGLMSDPNALGLVMALALWAFAFWRREAPVSTTHGQWHLLWQVVVGTAGMVSGSRTFLLGFAMLVAIALWQRARLWVGLAVVGGAALIGAVTLVDVYSTGVAELEQVQYLPEGLRRGIRSLSVARVSDTFGSRSLFIEIARKMSEGHLLFGVGPGKFSDYVPLIGVRSGIVRGWSDNANNLYLGILVELGLLGVLAAVAVVLRRTRTPLGRTSFGTSVLLGLAALMVTGPHIEFTEVALITAFFVGALTTTSGLIRGSWLRYLAMCVAVVSGAYAPFVREQGVFPWDDSDSAAVRWLSNRAQVELLCEGKQDEAASRSVLTVRARYIPQTAPLTVRVTEGATLHRELQLGTQEPLDVAIPCQDPGARSLVTITTEPPWSPYRAWPKLSGDRRLLGVEQIVRRVVR
jgi:hypothetical protein